MLKFERHKILSVVLTVLCSLVIAISLERVFSVGRTYIFGEVRAFINGTGALDLYPDVSMMTVTRVVFLFCIVFFLLLHIIVKINIFYEIAFKYRYAIATAVFFLLLVNKIHFSSIAMYDHYIQTGYGSKFVEPILGWARAIRSDEWLVSTPLHLSAQYDPDPFGRINMIARGTATENMPNGMAIGLATLAFPMNIFYLFGVEYGVSARWVGILILTFMVTFEFAYIISGKNKLLAVVGASLITFSPFFQWWSYVIFITAGMGALVCYYYFLNSNTITKRILYAFGIVVFISQFIVNLYPAWQIPAGYLFLGFAAWITVENRDKIREFKWQDYMIPGIAVILIAAVVAVYLHGSREYIAGISGTVYPGARHNNGGELGFAEMINKMMNGGVYSPMSPWRDFIYTNICEFGGIYTLFPIPLLFVSYMMIKKRNFDLLSIILITYTVFIGSYVLIGWPGWLSGITFMSYTASTRAMDVMLFAQVFLLIRAMSGFSAAPVDDEPGISGSKNFKKETVLLSSSLAAASLLTYIVIGFSRVTFTASLGAPFLIITFLGFSAVVYSLFDRQRRRSVFITACLYMIVISTATFIQVHPVMKGLDAIYSKPLSGKIRELAHDPDEKWISLHGIVGSSYLIANGASTISSTNFYPNLDLWYRLDPERIHEDEYNRYAVLTMELTSEDTSFDLLHMDHLHIKFSVNDLVKTGVKYIHSIAPLEKYTEIDFILLYNEGDSFIYSVNYEG